MRPARAARCHRAGPNPGRRADDGAAADIAWDDPEIAIPAFLTMAMIPLTFSIANGFAFGITAYALIKLLRGRIGRTDWLLLVLSALFVARFARLSSG